MLTGRFFALTLTLTGVPAFAESPYAGLEQREIKTLSEQQIGDLRAGRGMGLALAAELNGYPGPSHVLELSSQLDLTAGQRADVQKHFDDMQRETKPLGQTMIAQERELNKLFATRNVTAESLKRATADIATTQGAFRAAHLKYHLLTAAVLTPHQMVRYAELRGYGSGAATHSHGHRQH